MNAAGSAPAAPFGKLVIRAAAAADLPGYRFCGNPKRTTILDIIALFEDFPGEEPGGMGHALAWQA